MDSEGNKGIVTAGHCFDVGEGVYYSPTHVAHNAEFWGVCKYSAHDDGYIDAAFCVVNDPIFQPSNILFAINWGQTATGGQFQSADTLSTQLAQPPRGLIVNSIGATSGMRSGTVRYATLHILHNNSTRVAISDALIANYISEGGDSGGIVYAYQSSNNTRYTVGINKGRVSLREPNGEIETYAVCVKAYMINRRLGLTRY